MVTVLRFGNVLGTDIVTPISANLSRSLCPAVAGYDPLVQFVEEDDVVRCLEHVTRHRIPGLYNVAGPGKLPWSEVAEICGTRLLPLPPVATQCMAAPMVRLGLIDFPPELGGSPALRPRRGYPAGDQDRLHLSLHLGRDRGQFHPCAAATPQRGQDRRHPTPTSRTSSNTSAIPRP